MKNFKYSGQTITIVAAAALSSGDPVQVGDLFGVAVKDAEIGDSVEIQLAGVVSTIKKDETVAFAQGAPCYWDVADANLNDDDVNNKLAGYAYVAVLAADTHMTILLPYGPAAFN